MPFMKMSCGILAFVVWSFLVVLSDIGAFFIGAAPGSLKTIPAVGLVAGALFYALLECGVTHGAVEWDIDEENNLN